LPDMHTISVFHFLGSNAVRRNSPQSFVDRSRIIKVKLWIFVLQNFCHLLCMVMGDRWVHMMSYVSGSDVVMKEIQNWSVWSIDSVESSFDVVPIFGVKMRNIYICVLEPSV